MRRESLSNSATKPARGHCLTGLGRVPSPLGVGRGGSNNNYTRPQSAALLTVLHSEVSDSQTNQRFVVLLYYIHQYLQTLMLGRPNWIPRLLSQAVVTLCRDASMITIYHGLGGGDRGV